MIRPEFMHGHVPTFEITIVDTAALCLKLSSTFILSCWEVCPSINGLYNYMELFIEEPSDEAMVACTIPLEMSGILPEGKHYVREDNDIVISPTGNNKSG